MPQYYPFLNSERERLKTLDIKLDQLGQDPIYSSALENAALDLTGNTREPQDADFAIIEFTLTKILLSIIDNPTTSENYAEVKSGKFRDALEKESLTYLIKVAREDFGMEVKTEESLRVQFIDFLRYKPDFLKLSQMNLLKGYIQLSKSQLTWVLKGAIKKQILDGIPKSSKFPEDIVKIANNVKGKVVKVKGRIDRPVISSIREDALPPCIKGIVEALEAGKANHNAHFVLVTFLHGLNLDEKAIVQVFKRSPKFKENTALYQIRFSKERGYTCPACDSIKGYGLCTGDCPRKHPVSNYFINLRQRRQPKK